MGKTCSEADKDVIPLEKHIYLDDKSEEDTVSRKKAVLLIIFPFIFFFISLFLGRHVIDPVTVLKILAHKLMFFPLEQTWTDAAETVVMRVRMPRAIMAGAVGAGLSISGAAFQGMFHNPLVSPFILGVSAGAGFGAALAIVLNGSMVMIQLLAFTFGIIAVAITYFTSRIYKTAPILMLVLSGMVVSAFFQSLLSLLKYLADTEDKLPAILFWLMGSMSSVGLEDLPIALLPVIAGSVGLLLIRWRFNILSMGEPEARAMGINTELIKGITIFCTTIISSSIVAFCGIIGWVGLVIPHLCRMLVGPDHRVLMPTSLCIGAAYLILIDNLSRIISPAEVPLGILTAMVGAPFFAFLLRKTKGGWG
ncbi:MAG: iron ABC transporter permease [Syntrophomonas sp.]|nr:iron ABC transporter permease [Syntrophomonas sp.]